jgi:hypothetical protein
MSRLFTLAIFHCAETEPEESTDEESTEEEVTEDAEEAVEEEEESKEQVLPGCLVHAIVCLTPFPSRPGHPQGLQDCLGLGAHQR